MGISGPMSFLGVGGYSPPGMGMSKVVGTHPLGVGMYRGWVLTPHGWVCVYSPPGWVCPGYVGYYRIRSNKRVVCIY